MIVHPDSYPPSQGVIVSYSGGADSLCVLELCIKRYGLENVHAFFRYFLPDLDYTSHIVHYARRRFGITVHTYPSWVASDFLRNNSFRDADIISRLVPTQRGLLGAEQAARATSHLSWVGYGFRRAESVFRSMRLNYEHDIHGINWQRQRFAPISHWPRSTVWDYLRANNLHPLMVDEMTGFSIPMLQWIKCNFKNDYEKVMRIFPYASAEHAIQEERLVRKQELREEKRRAHDAAIEAAEAASRNAPGDEGR